MSSNEGELFKEISIWRRVDDNTLLRYRCLQALPDGGYFVKSSHFYYYPLNLHDEQLKLTEFYFVDGMFGDALLEIPKETCGTLEEAVAKYDKEFKDTFDEN